ncbi:MAG: PIG-L deacetylase family protein [Candidatus Hodarchaeales archaeon]|jgi:LmbE family N-acetylglucosaminyl deacetylase
MKKRNVLAVGAHADDIEIGCGGVIARHSERGDKTYIVIMTKPRYTYYDGTVLRSKEVGERESKKGAKVLGAKLIQFDFESKYLPYSGDSVEALNEVIDKFEIDTIYTHWNHDTHQDHNRTTRSVMSAGRYVPSILMFEPEYPAGRSYLGFRNQYYVDISSSFEKKVEAIKQHKSQVEKYGEERFLGAIEAKCRHRGYEIGSKYAECFEILRLLGDF